MKRLVYILLLGCLLLAAAACSRDPEVLPQPDADSVEPGITLTLVVPSFEAVETRAADVENPSIENLCLMFFSDDSSDAALLWCKPITSTSTEWLSDNGDTHETVSEVKVRVKLPSEANSDVRFVVVANANDKLSGLNVGTTTLAEVERITAQVASSQVPADFDTSSRMILSASAFSLIGGQLQLARNVAKVTVTSEDTNFKVDRLLRWEHINLSAGILDGCELATPAAASGNAVGDTAAAAVIYGAQSANSAASPVRIVFEGTYDGVAGYYAVSFDSETYPAVEPNHHYDVRILSVTRYGSEDPENPVEGDAVVATIVDRRPQIYDMITDGEYMLGVPDTIKLASGAARSQTFYVRMGWSAEAAERFDVSTLAAAQQIVASQLTVTAEQSSWITVSPAIADADVVTVLPSEEDSDASFDYGAETELGLLVKYTLTLEANTGIDRVGMINVTWGTPGTVNDLFREIVVVQPEDFSEAEDFLDVRVDMKWIDSPDDPNSDYSISSASYEEYFHRFAGDANACFMDDVEGLAPGDNGGRIRNRGFHFPLHTRQRMEYTLSYNSSHSHSHQFTSGYDLAQIKWKFEINEDFQPYLELSQTEGTGMSTLNGITFKIKEARTGADDFVYMVADEGLKLTLTEPATGSFGERVTTLTYGLYRTGFFFTDSAMPNTADDLDTDMQNYRARRYYEVMKMNGRWWLDRNLGASSAAFYVQNGDGSTYVGDPRAAGGVYSIFENVDGKAVVKTNVCPPNYRLPTKSEFQSLVKANGFSQTRLIAEDGTDYYDVRYTLTSNPIGRVVYFPKARMRSGDSPIGSARMGYYWTTTEALGASGSEIGWWYQYLSLIGRSASFGRYRVVSSGTDLNGGNLARMSVRCVNKADTDESEQSVKFYVKGYTHVCLGYMRDGAFDPIEALPGTQIALETSKDEMYHEYEYLYMAAQEDMDYYVRFYDSSDESATKIEAYRGKPYIFYTKDGGWATTAQ